MHEMQDVWGLNFDVMDISTAILFSFEEMVYTLIDRDRETERQRERQRQRQRQRETERDKERVLLYKVK